MADTRSPTGAARTMLAFIGSLTLAAMMAAARRGKHPPPRRPGACAPVPDPASANRSARRLNEAAGTLAASVLFDSAIEHYRGQFENRAMYTPIVTAALALAVSAHGTADRRQASHVLRDTVYAITSVVGLIGTGFHLFNIRKKPGRWSWQNLFYSAPIGAPMAIGLSGLLGFLSERVRDTPSGRVPRIAGLPAGRVVGAAAGLGLAGTTSEAGLLHFRGSFHDPFMYLPVTIPPIAAACLTDAAFGRARARRDATRWWLRATALLGISGTAFHATGVGRDMGGWRNWQQNILNGPPIPAPPAFTGLALAGLAALDLLEDDPDA
ncbi:hypothetical protein AA101099_0245 [Neoasaia chiangmaiensis NBRC 101099]|uniref:Uncharacterized protein n=1 Tax=Neoasaia chiangmaiensis TaxID=320497 RepID=A0A1U9KS05_9PROT|nr:hypothetical protein [Neoasaia chiangmaiensis]AQS88606.1 hypothetical protein A0U93_12430 [Neoasaia chiangmaiensis]GBR36133.1 hypothetical protein AA101099_0245 [Neoasaia chiangmaiensis NBRC 101099]GEN15462.1 hypothetical protein NCH01_18930 [Neoasaia chiangmaiensis]